MTEKDETFHYQDEQQKSRLNEPLKAITSGKPRKLTAEEKKQDDEFIKAAFASLKKKNSGDFNE